MQALLLVACALSGPPGGLTSAAALGQSTGDAVISGCTVQVLHDVEVPSQEAGLIVQLDLKPESSVNSGDVIAVIDSQREEIQKKAAEAAYDAARKQAENDVNTRFALAQEEVSQNELDRRLEINRRSRGAITESEIEQYKLQVKRAQLQGEQAAMEQDVAVSTAAQKAAELEAIEHSITRRTVKSRMDGVVAERLRDEGEWVREGDPIIRLVTMNELKVTGQFNLKDYSPAQLRNRPVVVTATIGGQDFELRGTVTNIGTAAFTGQCTVTAEVANERDRGEWILRDGMPVSMRVQL